MNLNGNQDTEATRTNILYDETRNAVLSTSTSKVFGLDTGHIIAAGESYDISYLWRDAWNWVDNSSEVRVSLFVTDDNTIEGMRRDLVQDLSGLSTQDSTWEEVVREGVYEATSADAGKVLFVAIDTTADVGYARLENFTLSIGTPSPTASNPNPRNNNQDVLTDTKLSWTAGAWAATHDIYLGTVFDDVNNADVTTPLGVLVSPGQDANTFDPTGLLEIGQTYYWRVDEVNAPPDFTIFKGNVWNFTTEPIAYRITGGSIIATASSSNNAEEGPENTVDGSGLDVNDLHSTDNPTMWLSSALDPNAAWIQYEFDDIQKLYQMFVWNHNTSTESAIGFGIKEATIEYSVDGTAWTVLGTTHEFARAPGQSGYAANTTIDLGGMAAKYVRITANSNWGGILTQYGLSEVRFSGIPFFAREPSPDSGAVDVNVDTILSWRAGREASTHNVYLSTDQKAVIEGTAPIVSMTDNSHSPALDLASTYYWRVDEVNEAETPAIWQGNIWNFSTQEYLLVDDFESYNDIAAEEEGSNLVYVTWKDGFDNPSINGSTIGYNVPYEPTVETSLVYDGQQSMPLFYDNTVAAYSEVTANVADLQAGRDWAKYGIKGLTLRFYGDPNNVLQQLYVKIDGTKVAYDGDVENLARTAWQMWYIDLVVCNAYITG